MLSDSLTVISDAAVTPEPPVRRSRRVEYQLRNRQDEQRIGTDVTDELTVERRERASAISATTSVAQDAKKKIGNLVAVRE